MVNLFYGYDGVDSFGIKAASNLIVVHNAGALGDLVASLGCLKWEYDTWFKPKNISFKVAVKPYFFELFSWLPKDCLLDIDQKMALAEPHVFMTFNDIIMTPKGPTARIHPIRMALWDYASIKFMNRVLPVECHNYPKLPIEKTDISKFDLPKRYAAVVANFSAENRQWVPEEFNKLMDHLISIGVTPVYVGKSKVEFQSVNVKYKVNERCDFTKGISLLDQTSIYEVAKIMNDSEFVITLDCGLTHLAGMTNAKIISFYTNVDPLKRMPIRNSRIGYNVWPIIPDVACRFCQSKWQVEGHDFNFCHAKHLNCIKQITADKYIVAINEVLSGKTNPGYGTWGEQ